MKDQAVKLCKCGCGRKVPTKYQYTPECAARRKKINMEEWRQLHREPYYLRKSKIAISNILKTLGITVAEVREAVQKTLNQSDFVEI